MKDEIAQIKVAILYVATADYILFWRDFFITYEQHFLKNCIVHYYVFTDADNILYQDNERVHIVKIEHREWPYGTLMRYHIILNTEAELMNYDYLYYMNANCVCINSISEEEFLPREKDLIVVEHFKYYACNNMDYSYERNPKSLAYIPYGEGKYYICGGINGGRTEAYLNLCKELKHRIDIDLSNGIIALFHDESHINRYIIDYKNYEIRSSEYVFPEGWDLPYTPKIITRDKRKYFNLNSSRGIQTKLGRRDKVVIKIEGDLGGRLFQYALAKQLKFMGKNVFVDSDYEEDFEIGIPKASRRDVRDAKRESFFLKHAIKVILNYPQRQTEFIEGTNETALHVFSDSRGYFIGKWQSEQWFEGIKDQIREEFKTCVISIGNTEDEKYVVGDDLSFWKAYLRKNSKSVVTTEISEYMGEGYYKYYSVDSVK